MAQINIKDKYGTFGSLLLEEKPTLPSTPILPTQNTGVDFGVQTTTPTVSARGTIDDVKKGLNTVLAIGKSLTTQDGRKAFVEGFVEGTPQAVAAIEQSASIAAEEASDFISFIAEATNLPGNLVEFYTDGKIKPEKLQSDVLNDISLILQQNSAEHIKMSQNIQTLNMAIEDPVAFADGIQDPKFIAKNLGMNAVNFLAALGVGAAATTVGGPGAGVVAGFATSAVLEGGFAYNEAKSFLENSDDPMLQLKAYDREYLEKIAAITGIANGMIDALPIGNLLTRSPVAMQARRTILRQILSRIIKQSLLEGSTESLQEIVSNVVAKNYDRDRSVFSSVPESAFFGTIMGGTSATIVEPVKSNEEILKEYPQLAEGKLPIGITFENGSIKSEFVAPGLTTEDVSKKLQKIGKNLTSEERKTMAEYVDLVEDFKSIPFELEAKVNDMLEEMDIIKPPSRKKKGEVERGLNNEETAKLLSDILDFNIVTATKAATKEFKAEEKQKAKSEAALVQEARKYKSAEEFVKAVNKGETVNVPIGKISGLEPQPAPFPTAKRTIKEPVEITLTDQGDFILEAGNHRYHQAVFNGDTTIPAKIRLEPNAKSQLTDIWKQANKAPKLPKAADFSTLVETVETELADAGITFKARPSDSTNSIYYDLLNEKGTVVDTIRVSDHKSQSLLGEPKATNITSIDEVEAKLQKYTAKTDRSIRDERGKFVGSKPKKQIKIKWGQIGLSIEDVSNQVDEQAVQADINRKQVSERIDDVKGDIAFELETAQPGGELIPTEDGYRRRSGNWPSFFPQELRSSRNIEVAKQILNGDITPKTAKQKAIAQTMIDAIASRIGEEDYADFEYSELLTQLEKEAIGKQRAFYAEIINKIKKERKSKSATEIKRAVAESTGQKKSDFIRKRESTLLKTRIKAIEKGFREGQRFTKQEIARIQTEVLSLLEESDLSPKDRDKFRRLIKNIQTQEQLEKAMPEIRRRIDRLTEAAERRGVKRSILGLIKTTKPRKQAGKPIGKFTPEIQTTLDIIRTALRGKLSDEAIDARIQENLQKSTSGIVTPEIALENRVLSLWSGSNDDLTQLYGIVNTLAEEGRILSSMKEFNLQEDISRKRNLVIQQATGGEGLPAGMQTTGKPIKTASQELKAGLKSLGSRWVLSWQGLLSVIDFNAGVENNTAQEVFNVHDQETKYKELQSNYVANLNQAIADAYDIKNERSAIQKKIIDGNTQVDLGVFINGVGEEVHLIFTKAELMKLEAELQDPTLEQSFFDGNSFTPEIIDAIHGALTEQDLAFVDAAMEMWANHYEVINEVYGRVNGVNLPKNPFYSPIKRTGFDVISEAGLGEFVQEMNSRAGVSNGSLISRVGSVLPIQKQNIFEALDRHFTETNYYVAWAEKVREFDTVFKDSRVRFALDHSYGNGLLTALDNTINDLASSGNRHARRYKALDTLRKQFTLGALMIKPALTAKQMVSTLAYLEKLGPIEFTAGVLDFWRNPIANAKILNEESVYIRERGENMERDIKAAMKSDVFSRYSKTRNFINTLMMNFKLGDKGAILTGAWAIRRARLNAGIELASAIREYERFSNETQQSSDLSQLSEVQRGGSLEQLWTMFRSSQRQYYAKEVNAVKTLFQQGGTSRENIQKVARTLFIYHVLLPVTFQYIANFGGWSDEDKKDYVRAGILGSINGIFILGDAVDSIIRAALGLNVFDVSTPITDILNDVSNEVRKIDFDDIDAESMTEAVGALLQAGTGLGVPVQQAKLIYNGAEDLINGDVKNGLGQLLGWSEYALKIEKDKKKKGKIQLNF